MIKMDLNFKYDDLCQNAKNYFLKISRLDENKPEDLNLIKCGENVKEKYFGQIEVKTKIASFDNSIFCDKKLHINGVNIKSEKFNILQDSTIENIYLYMLTLGDLNFYDDEGTLEQYYFHVWGTAFIEAGREMLETKLIEKLHANLHLTNSFDPGFDGMDIRTTIDILQITNGEDIGISANENGLMSPLKTVAGIYFAVNDKEQKVIVSKESFVNCTVNSVGCDFCIRRNSCPIKNVSKDAISTNVEELEQIESKVLEKLETNFEIDTWFKGECEYGIAYDIGTTTVVGFLWNLRNSKLIGVSIKSNRQAKHGADIVSRLAYGLENPDNILELKNELLTNINEIITEFCEKNNIETRQIGKIVLAGNTAISHFIMGVNPKSLTVAPFKPVFVDSKTGRCRDMGIALGPQSTFYLMPNLACHVGSDITAGLIAEFNVEDEKALFIDIGTNGEMAIIKQKEIVVTSAAAGPAFEGASIYNGMRAEIGAVEKVEINKEKVSLTIKGNGKPKGICGSGIIDCTAAFLNNDILDETGRLTTSEELKEKGYEDEVNHRIREGKLGKEFFLANGDNLEIVILQKDIREIQMAKAAFSVAIKFLMEELNLDVENLDKVYLAGAFGNNINLNSAIKIGVLPNINEKKVKYAGNAAGIGASMVLLSESAKKRGEFLSQNVKHLEVTGRNNFQDEFIKALNFK